MQHGKLSTDNRAAFMSGHNLDACSLGQVQPDKRMSLTSKTIKVIDEEVHLKRLIVEYYTYQRWFSNASLIFLSKMAVPLL